MTKRSFRPILPAILLCAVAGSSWNALAAPPAQGGAEVTVAEQAHLISLRGAMPRSDELSKSPINHPARPLPWLDGPGSPVDNAVQVTVTAPAAATLGLGFDGVGKGFTGPQGTFMVNSAPPDTNGAVGTTP